MTKDNSETIKELMETSRYDLCETIIEQQKKLQAAEEENKTLREALEFYSHHPSPDFRRKIKPLGVDYEDGTVARQALEKVGGGE